MRCALIEPPLYIPLLSPRRGRKRQTRRVAAVGGTRAVVHESCGLSAWDARLWLGVVSGWRCAVGLERLLVEVSCGGLHVSCEQGPCRARGV